MLREGHLSLILSSLLNSIFVNLSCMLGLAAMVDSYKYKDQKFNREHGPNTALLHEFGSSQLRRPGSLLLSNCPLRDPIANGPSDLTPRVNGASSSFQCSHAPIQPWYLSASVSP